ncbi:MAG: FtsW/RodA/SpoVE family cell cycle protein [Sutterella wadsworthensis]|nr:FtsW/RodA/SpoVE family cell cycle protein [Sutterella wadsworthensis]
MTRFEEFDDFRLSAPGVDRETIFCVAALLAFGTVMVFSATSSSGAGDALAAANTGELKRHLASIGLAGAAALVVYRVPLSFWFRWSGIIGGLCIILLCIVFLPVVGKSVNGARRWIQIAGLSIQASELVKVGALIFAAAFTVKRQPLRRKRP